MAKIIAMPTSPALRSLWDVHQGIESVTREKPRDATAAEVRAYLLTLAQRRGVYVPAGATISEAGIYAEGTGYIVDMPGYGTESTVIMEELDDAGAVVRTSRIGCDAKGKFGLDAAAVRAACALPKPVKARKPRTVKAAPVAEVAAQPEPIMAPVCQPEAIPAPIVDASVADLVARLAALESVVARLSRPVVAGKRVRTEAERRAVLRAWRMRGEMRERADLDRRALLKVNGDNRLLHETLLRVEAERNELREQAANARRAATEYRTDLLVLDRARSAATARALRMVSAAKRHRTAARRAAIDLRAAQAEARALTRRLAAAPVRERAAPDMMTLHARVADRADA